MNLHPNEPEPREQSPPDMDDEAEDVSIKEANLSKKVEAILKTHCIAIRQLETPSYHKIVEKLGKLSTDSSAFKSITRAEILAHMINMSERFRHFALQQKLFVRLPKNDQRLLLARNTALYIQLYMGCFFGAPCGAQQKELIQKYHIITRKMKLLEYTRVPETCINMFQFNSVTRLFREDADLDTYANLIEVFKKIKMTNLEARAIVSYLILFDYDDSLNLSCKDLLKKFAAKKQELFERAFGKTGLIGQKELMTTLVKMAVFGAYNIHWDDIVLPTEPNCLTSCNLVIPYSDEEEAWLKKQMQHFDDLFYSVPIGDELAKESMKYSLGEPLSKHFFCRCFAVFLERFWRVIKFNPEVVNLGKKDGEQLNQNCKEALALCIARMETCPDGLTQLKVFSSETDMTCWEVNYFQFFGKKKEVKKISIQGAADTSSIPLTKEDLTVYHSIVPSLQVIVADIDIFKIVTLIVLSKCDAMTATTDPEATTTLTTTATLAAATATTTMAMPTMTTTAMPTMTTTPNYSLSRLHSHMKILLKRRLDWKQVKGLVYAEIMNSLGDLPALTETLCKIIRD